jgi:multidrug efflux pump subunit AcrA (membrane-fusion protein)
MLSETVLEGSRELKSCLPDVVGAQAELSGTVVKVLVENSQAVTPGQALMIIKPN